MGATVDFKHRLRQHNCEIKGGAKYTSAGVKAGHKWLPFCVVSGFPDDRAALQFEWKWKADSVKQKGNPAERRVAGLIKLLNSDKSTSTAQPFISYAPLKVEVMIRGPETDGLFTSETVYGSFSYHQSLQPQETQPQETQPEHS